MLWNNHFGIHNWQKSLKCLNWILLDRVYSCQFLNFIQLIMRKRWKKSANSSQFLKNPLIMYIYYHTIEKSVLNMKLLSCLVWQWLPIYYSTVCVWNTRQVSNLPHFEKNCRPRPHVKEFLTLCWTKLFVSFGTLQYKSQHELLLDTKDHARICCIYSAVTTQQIYSTNNKQYRHLSMQRSRIFEYVPKQNLSWLIINT